MKTLMLLLLSVLIFSYSYNVRAQDGDAGVVSDVVTNVKNDDEPEGVRFGDGLLYGAEFGEDIDAVTYEELISSVDKFGDQVIVLTGTINEVCQKAGCWFTMGEGKEQVRIMTKHEFFVPKNSGGKNARVAGVFKIAEISEDQALHYNEESENPVDPSEISGPQRSYIFEASGVVLSD